MKISITQRLTVLWSALFVLTLFVFAGVAAAFVDRSAQVALDQRLLAQSVLAASGVDGQSGRLEIDFPKLPLPGSAVAVYRAGKLIQVVGDRPPAEALRAAAAIALGTPVSLAVHEPLRAVAHRVSESGDLRVAAFASEIPLREEAERLRRTFIAVGLPLILAAVLAGWFLARRSLAPIDRLIRTAADVAQTGRFSSRFRVQTQDELGRLGSTFNAMLERLETTYERERGFIGDVSHELRQPLTAITGETQLALTDVPDMERYRDALRQIDGQASALGSLVDDLLLLARADADALGPGTAELSDALAEAANSVRPMFPNVTLSAHLREEPMNVGIAAPLLVRLFANIVRNAMQFARSRVDVTASREGGEAVVRIDDDGPGIPAPARSEVLRRFHRLPRDAQHPGTGLGLAIAAAIAAAANGSITVDDAPSGGARFIVRLRLVA